MSRQHRVAELTDPDAGSTPPCPCHISPLPVGTARGWLDRQGPAELLRRRHGLSDAERPASWVDHAYRLRLEDGRWRFVAEPYELTEEALADLTFLADRGYDVAVCAWRARHYPGHTVAVEITPGASPANPGG